jgi:hypothetical protein
MASCKLKIPTRLMATLRQGTSSEEGPSFLQLPRLASTPSSSASPSIPSSRIDVPIASSSNPEFNADNMETRAGAFSTNLKVHVVPFPPFVEFKEGGKIILRLGRHVAHIVQFIIVGLSIPVVSIKWSGLNSPPTLSLILRALQEALTVLTTAMMQDCFPPP